MAFDSVVKIVDQIQLLEEAEEKSGRKLDVEDKIYFVEKLEVALTIYKRNLSRV